MTIATELAQSILDADSAHLHMEVCTLLDLDTDAPLSAPLLTHLLTNADIDVRATIQRLVGAWLDGFAAGLIASDTEMDEMLEEQAMALLADRLWA